MQRFVYIQTFGCQMNVYDTERILQVLKPLQYEPTQDESKADLILLNSCTVREKAEVKMMSRLGRFAPLKDHNPDLIIGVGGCVAQQEGARLLKKTRYLDLVFGPDTIANLPELLERVRTGGERVSDTSMHKKVTGYDFIEAEPQYDGRPNAMVTVMKGCNKTCAYCIVPRVRGRELSKPKDQVVAEVERYVAHGVKEVMLLGQNVNSYGHDRKDGVLFPDLLDAVDAVEGLERLRFTTSHPWDCTDELVARFDGRLNSLCEYFHLPIQSGSDRILEAMRRGYTADSYIERSDRLREACPDMVLSTDIIVGFPGETEADFQATLDLMERVGFDHVFGFSYSPRLGTSAAKLEDDISKELKSERLQRVFEIANRERAQRLQKYADQVVEVLVEGPSKGSLKAGQPPQLAGRTRTNVVVNFAIPNLKLGAMRLVGELVNIRIQRVLPHSLVGEIVLVH
ncbi:MAG: tRNA-2-methylthio-N6-dimethylallyladenosine synthase [Myxococcota bacterium]|jgi:tRNA-2-methylthio-N6-dimethylallyladenosine synthase